MKENKDRKKILFCLILIIIAIIGIIVSIGVILAKLGTAPLLIYLFFWLAAICSCVMCKDGK